MEYFTAKARAIQTDVTRSGFRFSFEITRLSRKRSKTENVRSEI